MADQATVDQFVKRNEGRFIWALATVMCVLILSIAGYHVFKIKVLVDAGYHQQTLRGVGGTYWVKYGKEESDAGNPQP